MLTIFTRSRWKTSSWHGRWWTMMTWMLAGRMVVWGVITSQVVTWWMTATLGTTTIVHFYHKLTLKLPKIERYENYFTIWDTEVWYKCITKDFSLLNNLLKSNTFVTHSRHYKIKTCPSYCSYKRNLHYQVRCANHLVPIPKKLWENMCTKEKKWKNQNLSKVTTTTQKLHVINI